MISLLDSKLTLAVTGLFLCACSSDGVSLGDDRNTTPNGGASAAGSSGENAGGSTIAGGASGSGGTLNSGGSAGVGAAGAGGGSGGSIGPSECENPTALSGNWEACDNGLVHRTAPGTCDSKLPGEPIGPSGSDMDQCTSDADCTSSAHGYCTSGGFAPGNVCLYGCVEDSDCQDGQICVCGETIGTCSSVEDCTSDADCVQGSLCTSFALMPGCPPISFACQSAGDECASNADCSAEAPECTFAEGHRVCAPRNCAI